MPKNPITSHTTFKHHAVRFSPNGALESGTVYMHDAYGNTAALTAGISSASIIRWYLYENTLWKLQMEHA